MRTLKVRVQRRNARRPRRTDLEIPRAQVGTDPLLVRHTDRETGDVGDRPRHPQAGLIPCLVGGDPEGHRADPCMPVPDLGLVACPMHLNGGIAGLDEGLRIQHGVLIEAIGGIQYEDMHRHDQAGL